MTHLDQLEEKSIYLLRESFHYFNGRLAMLWSIGKDSTVMLHLARKAFLGKIPFPLIHIDTRYKIPAMIDFRDQQVRLRSLDMIVGQNPDPGRTFPEGGLSRLECCQKLKTDTLLRTAENKQPRKRYDPTTQNYTPDSSGTAFRALIMGIRSDEEGSRSKERYFSVRGEGSAWNIEHMPPELWNEFNSELHKNQSLRVHPLLDWSEKNIWQYIEREKIEVTPLYFADANGERYRSLGCAPCTAKIKSDAKSPADIVAELTTGELAKKSERSGRAQDQENGNSLETLRRKGYM